MAGYCDPSDIDMGGVLMPNPDPREGFINDATDEMDAKLGTLYATPLNIEALKDHERKMLKMICRKIASGRLLATYAIADEGGSVHAYARRLLDEGQSELHLIANGDIVLSAARADHEGESDEADDSGVGAAGSRMPSVYNPDSESLLTPFHREVFGGIPTKALGPDDTAY